ncbi:MAG: nucleotidyltransferase family protein [Gemmatimonadetes bacterium]|nr:nucleotidyltransferase family protein [Gemmatimonadota bacterium]MXY83291.1 nucleotidyltransferase family protein [Gemmatimonadota bacterium]MYB68394.1 nucleotidyltransferase family protein [Gemmatimonadota bacterium]
MTQFTDLSGIVLAAGRSFRMEGANKLLLPWKEQCVLQVAVERICEVGLGEVIVVTGHQRAEVGEALSRYPVRLVHNPKFAEGMAASIRVGVEAAIGEQGYLFALGDMPQITGKTMLKVAETLTSTEAIAVPVRDGRRGHPVAIGSAYRDALLALTGDRGARAVLAKNAANIVEVSVEDEGIFVDVDTQESYRAARTAW